MKEKKRKIDLDLTVESKPWTTEELSDFRKIMNVIKSKNTKTENKILNIQKTKKLQVQ